MWTSQCLTKPTLWKEIGLGIQDNTAALFASKNVVSLIEKTNKPQNKEKVKIN